MHADLRINDEPFDPQTCKALNCLSKSATRDQAKLTCSAILALFKRFEAVCAQAHRSNGSLISSQDALNTLKKLLRQLRPKDLFTSSSDRRQRNNPEQSLIDTRVDKIKKFHLKGELKGGPAPKSKKAKGRKGIARAPCLLTSSNFIPSKRIRNMVGLLGCYSLET